jgi:hypothetical protein
VQLDAGKSGIGRLPDGGADQFGVGIGVQARVAGQIVAAAAQEAVDWGAGDLTRDVPQRDIYR